MEHELPRPPHTPTDEDKLKAFGLPKDEYEAAQAAFKKQADNANDPDVQRTWYNNHVSAEMKQQYKGPDAIDRVIARIKNFFRGRNQ